MGCDLSTATAEEVVLRELLNNNNNGSLLHRPFTTMAVSIALSRLGKPFTAHAFLFYVPFLHSKAKVYLPTAFHPADLPTAPDPEANF